MTYLGLDLGTGLAKLARCPAGEQAGPAVPDVTMVSSAVTYRDLGAADIPSGYPDEPWPGTLRCDGFPALLGTALSASRVDAWRGRTPDEVTAHFLRCLLDPTEAGMPRDPASAGRSATVRDGGHWSGGMVSGLRVGSGDEEAEPAGLVVAVPPDASGRRGVDDKPSAATTIQDILTALGRSPQRGVAAPVASLLWLRQRHQSLVDAGRIVVIDAGAGSIEISLCQVTGPAVRVVDSVRLLGGSAWGAGDPADAAAGVRPPSIAELLVTALAAVSGEPLGSAGRMPVYLWRMFERALADPSTRERLDMVLQLASTARHRHGGALALRFAGLDVTASQLLDACEPLAQESVAALGRLLGRQLDPGWQRFGGEGSTRLVLLGGLSVLRPMRVPLLASLGLDPDGSGEGVIRPDDDDLLGAAARGAALLAAGQADPGDRYPFELRLPVNRVVRDRVVTEYLRLAAPGSIDLETAQTTYFHQGAAAGSGQHLLVTVRPAVADRPGAAPISVQLVPRGGSPVPATFRAAMPPPPGVYRVGVQGGPDGPAVVLQPAEGGNPLTYPLAEPAGSSVGWSPAREVR